MERIISMTPADRWYFVHESLPSDGYSATYHRVAVWATYETGETIGLVSVHAKPGKSLAGPPPVDGAYLHWDELTEKQREEALQMARPRFLKDEQKTG